MKKIWFQNTNSGGCEKICDFIFDGYKVKKDLPRYKSLNMKVKEKTKKLEQEKEKLQAEINRLEGIELEFQQIIHSKSWKVLEKIRKFIKR